jgi:UDP-galactopyranose mutase
VDIDDTFVLNYMRQYVDLRELKHHCMTFVGKDSAFYNYPIHQDDIMRMPDRDQIKEELKNRPPNVGDNFEDYLISSVGKTLYDKFYNSYSKKMWQVKSNKMFESPDFYAEKNIESIKTGSKQAFADTKTIWYPKQMDGFNSYFEQCIDGCRVIPNTEVTEFDVRNKSVRIGEDWLQGDIMVSTVSPDMLFDYQYGELSYIGREFLKVILPIERITPDPYFFLYYANDEPFTRIVEYKLLTGYQSPNTLIIIEMPSFNNKLYPYPIITQVEKAQKYLADLPEGVFSVGRMGKYDYDNMDVVIKDCKKMAQIL